MMHYYTDFNLTKLDICLAKCTNPLMNISEELIDELCMVANSQTNGPYTMLRFLAYKAQSPQESEALHSLNVLEMVVKRGGYKITDEIGKFRFLNEIIKIVSPKYLAHQTSIRVGQKIIELIFQWSMDFKELPKIFEAYQMLKVQKIVLEDPIHVLKNYRPPTPPKPRPKDEIFDDEQTVKTLRSLIESGRTENFEEANRMIKNLAMKAESRIQFKTNLNSELESAKNCAHLLNEMLTQCNDNMKFDQEKRLVIFKGTTDEDIQLMKELLNTCENARFRLYSFTNQITENDQQELKNIIEVSDMLISTINSCKRYFTLLDDQKLIQCSSSSSSQINSVSIDNIRSNRMDHNYSQEERLLDFNITPLSSPKKFNLENIENELEENEVNTNFDNNELLRDFLSSPPILVASLENIASTSNKSIQNNNKDLKELSDMFIQQNLNPFPYSSDSKKLLPDHNDKDNNNNNNSNNNNVLSKINKFTPDSTDLCELLSHTNIISYEEIRPCREMRPPLLVFNKDGLMVNLHFTGNSPHRQISVFLLTFSNYNQFDISDIHFLAAVPKKMKVKLQYQTGSSLPGLKRGKNFPETFISQIMLIACDNSLTSSLSDHCNHHFPNIINNNNRQERNKILALTKDYQLQSQQEHQKQRKTMIQFKLKFKISYVIQEKLYEHVSQLVWHWDLDHNGI